MTLEMFSKSKIITVAAIFILLMIVPVLAQNIAPDSVLLSPWPDWTLWVAVVIMITILLLGIGYMIAKTFGIPAWEAFVKEEMINVLYTVLIVVFFISFLGIVESLANEFAKEILYSQAEEIGSVAYWQYNPGTGRWGVVPTDSPDCPTPCHFYIARGFLGVIYEDLGSQMVSLAKHYGVTYYLLSTTLGGDVRIWEWVWFHIGIRFGVPVYSGKAIYVNTLEVALNVLLRALPSVKAQEVALGYLQNMGGILLVIGLVARVPWFTRKFGGLMIALAIGVYVILPLVYVLGWYVVDRSSVSITETQFIRGGAPIEADPVLGGETQLEAGDRKETFKEYDSGFGEIADLSSGKIDLLFTEYTSGGNEVRLGLLDSVSRTYIVTLLIPVLAIFTTIGFVRHFSPMIGGDPEIAGLTRLI